MTYEKGEFTSNVSQYSHFNSTNAKSNKNKDLATNEDTYKNYYFINILPCIECFTSCLSSCELYYVKTYVKTYGKLNIYQLVIH